MENQKICTLSHAELFRPGELSGIPNKRERLSVDFLVDGCSLLQLILKTHLGHSDFIGCFIRSYAKYNHENMSTLTVKRKPDTSTKRVMLYTCPECMDIGCGAFSARVSKLEGYYVWSDFAYENDYMDARTIENIGPFVFEAKAYELAIKAASKV